MPYAHVVNVYRIDMAVDLSAFSRIMSVLRYLAPVNENVYLCEL